MQAMFGCGLRVKSRPSPAVSKAAEEGYAADEVMCAICLGSGEAHALRCSHSFCRSCLEVHVSNEIGKGRRPWCPLCRREVLDAEVMLLIPYAARVGIPPPPPSSSSQDALGDASFRRIARRLHLKKCPRCAAVIQKNGGCPRMTCRCGCRFRWEEAETVVPCQRVHFTSDLSSLFCKTCAGCSGTAKVKLTMTRAGVIFLGAPIVALAAVTLAGGALAVLSTAVSAPALFCAPLALAYEPVRLVNGYRENPFAQGMLSGARLVKRLFR